MTRGVLLGACLLSACATAAAPPPVAAPAEPARQHPRPLPPPEQPTVVVVERPAPEPPAAAAGTVEVARRLEMRATGYCLRGNMRTGIRTRDGMVATDPTVIPLGSVIRVSHPDGRPVGLFVAMDTGGAIRGNKIDLYMESCREAIVWGIRPVVVEVIRIGWER